MLFLFYSLAMYKKCIIIKNLKNYKIYWYLILIRLIHITVLTMTTGPMVQDQSNFMRTSNFSILLKELQCIYIYTLYIKINSTIWFWPINSNFHLEDCIWKQTCENQLWDDMIIVDLVVKEVIHTLRLTRCYSNNDIYYLKG